MSSSLDGHTNRTALYRVDRLLQCPTNSDDLVWLEAGIERKRDRSVRDRFCYREVPGAEPKLLPVKGLEMDRRKVVATSDAESPKLFENRVTVRPVEPRLEPDNINKPTQSRAGLSRRGR